MIVFWRKLLYVSEGVFGENVHRKVHCILYLCWCWKVEPGLLHSVFLICGHAADSFPIGDNKITIKLQFNTSGAFPHLIMGGAYEDLHSLEPESETWIMNRSSFSKNEGQCLVQDHTNRRENWLFHTKPVPFRGLGKKKVWLLSKPYKPRSSLSLVKRVWNLAYWEMITCWRHGLCLKRITNNNC